MSKPIHFLVMAAALAASTTPLHAGFFYSGTTPANPPWPGGTAPYVIDPTLSAAQQQAYLDGMREWELAGNVRFIPHTSEPEYLFLKFDSGGPNQFSGTQPIVVEINALTRSQICHEIGHTLGLTHEHIRPDRDDFVTVLTANISSGNEFRFDIDPTGVTRGSYDFESVMHFGRDLFSSNPGTLDTLSANPGFERYQVRMGNFALSPGDRAAIAWLYGSVTLTPVVTTTADAGPGSLRAALYFATDHPGTTVTFNIPTGDPGYSDGVFTIRPTGHLPPLVTDGTVVDATSQPGYTDKPLVFIDGSGVLPESGEPPGLMIHAADCTIKGLGFTHSRWVGVAMSYPDCSGNTVTSCWSGVGPAGNAAQPNIKQGVQISDGAHDNTIGPGNLLSGNTEYGIWISGASTTGNIVRGNRIGTNADGDAALANGYGGAIVTDGAHDNTIGEGNVLSGNVGAGVWLTGAGVQGNLITGNLIGLNAAGDAAVPNDSVGVHIVDGASNNRAAGNVLSGNNLDGLRVADPGSTGNLIEGNLVGTNAAGTAAVPNGSAGLTVYGGAGTNFISGNVLSGNGDGFGYGIVIGDSGSDGNTVEGNLIGVLPNGAPLGNAFAGLAIWDGAKNSLIAGNLIRNNGGSGIALYDPADTNGHTFSANSISGNSYIGISIGSANHGQAAPILTSAESAGAGLTIAGSLASTPDSGFRIEFFSSAAGVTDNGSVFLGALDHVMTDSGGNAGFNPLLATAVLSGKAITATATDEATGDTSAFSSAVLVALTGNDSDSDQIPDDHESSHGLTVGVNDAALDDDGDGVSNLAEYLAGTDPQNGADFFRATSVTRMGGGLVVKFRVAPGRIYQIWGSETLAAGSWRILVPVATAGTNELEISTPFTPGRHFYRAALLE